MKIKVGKVSEVERDEILDLYERKNGLNELSKILTSDNKELYEMLVKDIGKTNVKYQEWWSNASKKYNWENSENGSWEIDFQTCNIFLITND